MNNWNDLSMKEKAAMMKIAVGNGIYNLSDIRKAYNEYAEGGPEEKDVSKVETAEQLLERFKDTPFDPLEHNNWAHSDEQAREYLIKNNLRLNEDAPELRDYFSSYVNSEGYQRIINNQYDWWKSRHPYKKLVFNKVDVTPVGGILSSGLEDAVEKDTEQADKNPPIYAIDGYHGMSFHRPGNGTYIYKGADVDNFPYTFTLGHEYAHRFEPRVGSSGQLEVLEQNSNTKEGHDSKWYEKYADQWGLKYLLYKEGIYDSRSNEDVTPEQIEQLRKVYPKLRPLQQMDNDKAAWMLNHVAYNPTEQQDSLNITALGGPLIQRANKFYDGGDGNQPYTPFLNDTPMQAAMRQIQSPEARAAYWNATHPQTTSETPIVAQPDGTFRRETRNIPLNTAGEAAKTALEFTPVIGDAMYAGDVVDEARQGNYGTAAVLAGLAVLPNVVEKPLKRGLKKIGLFDNATTAAKATPAEWTAAQDAAIARGDMVEAQRLSDLHADINGYLIEGAHGSKISDAFNTFYTEPHVQGSLRKPSIYDGNNITAGAFFGDNSSGAIDQFAKEGQLKNYRLRMEHPLKTDAQGRRYDELLLPGVSEEEIASQVEKLRKEGFDNYSIENWIKSQHSATSDQYALKAFYDKNYDSAIIENVYEGHMSPGVEGSSTTTDYIITSPNQAKLSDAVTYADDGTRIGLGERHNRNINDIRYIWPTAILGGTAAASYANQQGLGGPIVQLANKYEEGGPYKPGTIYGRPTEEGLKIVSPEFDALMLGRVAGNAAKETASKLLNNGIAEAPTDEVLDTVVKRAIFTGQEFKKNATNKVKDVGDWIGHMRTNIRNKDYKNALFDAGVAAKRAASAGAYILGTPGRFVNNMIPKAYRPFYREWYADVKPTFPIVFTGNDHFE